MNFPPTNWTLLASTTLSGDIASAAVLDNLLMTIAKAMAHFQSR